MRPGGGPGWPTRDTGYRWASAIDLIYMIKMVVGRASATLTHSDSKQNDSSTLKLHRGGTWLEILTGAPLMF